MSTYRNIDNDADVKDEVLRWPLIHRIAFSHCCRLPVGELTHRETYRLSKLHVE
jgi:hypothetical protein